MDQNGNHELAHAGVKNMKWGIRRFQNKDGSLTPLGRKHYGIGPGRKAKEKAAKAEQKAAKAKAKSDAKTKKIIETEEQRKARKEKESEAFEAAKQKALRSGSASEVLKFQGHLTNKELSDVYQRLNSEKLIKSIAKEDAKAAAEAAKKNTVWGKMERASEKIDSAVKAYKSVKSVVDIIQDAQKKNKETADAAEKAKRNKYLKGLTADDIVKAGIGSFTAEELKTLSGKVINFDTISKKVTPTTP